MGIEKMDQPPISVQETSVSTPGKEVETPKMPHLEFPFNSKKEYSEAEVEAFFTDEILSERVLYIPTINRDLTDHFGMFGYEPGFVFIEGINPQRGEEAKNLNEYAWLNGLSTKETNTPVHYMEHWDSFPYKKFDFTIITPGSHLPIYQKIYEFLVKKLGKIEVKEEKNVDPTNGSKDVQPRALPKRENQEESESGKDPS